MQFTEATKTKLILEIAGYSQYKQAMVENALQLVAINRARMTCLEGEQIRRERWGN
jgi:hypothetical protein